jgi:hypothetical protein
LPQGDAYHFETGWFYPKKRQDPLSGGLRLQFADSSAGAIVEEDVDNFGEGFACASITGIESSVVTPTGRSICYLSATPAEARFYVSPVLYKIYFLPPMPRVRPSGVPTLLFAFVDHLE